jgi:hypothetical protein
MSKLSVQQLRGLQDLIQETIAAGTSAIEETHQAIARQPFTLLEQIDAIAVPVRTIEHLERAVTGSVYQTIRAVNRLSGILATQALDCLEEPENLLNGAVSVTKSPYEGRD